MARKEHKQKEEPGLTDSCLYFDITKQERDSAIRYLLGAIIKCRNEEGMPSNMYTFDEDVNVYLAHLLFAVSLPEYHEMANPYLSKESSDILKWVNATEDHTIRYFIFKVNADHLLIHSAIFDDLVSRSRQKFFKVTRNHYRELAKLYYDQAAAYHKRIYRKKTGVGDVLEKLAHYYEAYQDLLKHVRREYFHFVNSFRDQVFRYFTREVTEYERRHLCQIKMDEFLDLYSGWLETKSPELEKKIEALVGELQKLDPDFHFDLIKNFHENRGGGFNERKCA
ncbi:MAG TPA: hypothetical protein VD913_01595 [bacterium]|nr:hypothetical protein [bacterium]